MNELLKLKQTERAVGMWFAFDDQAMLSYFKPKKEVVEEIAGEEITQKETNPLKLAIKKPSNQKGLNGQGFKNKRRPAFY